MWLSSRCERRIGLGDDRRRVGRAVAEHGEQDVGAAAGQADQGGVVPLALGSFAVVVGAADGVQRYGRALGAIASLRPILRGYEFSVGQVAVG